MGPDPEGFLEEGVLGLCSSGPPQEEWQGGQWDLVGNLREA